MRISDLLHEAALHICEILFSNNNNNKLLTSPLLINVYDLDSPLLITWS